MISLYYLCFPVNFIVSHDVLEGSNTTLESGVSELQEDHIVEWTMGPDFGGKLIAQRKNSIIFIDEDFTDFLQLNPHNGSLTFIRVTETNSGFYCVKLLLGGQPHIRMQYRLTVFGRCFNL